MYTTLSSPPSPPPVPFSLPPASPRQSPFVMQSGAEGLQPQPQLPPALLLRSGVTHGRVAPFHPHAGGLGCPPLRMRGKPPAAPWVSGGTGGERPRESPEPPAEAGVSRRSKCRPGAGGPSPVPVRPVLPGGGSTPRRLPAPTPRERRLLGGWQHPRTAGTRPRLASPVPLSLSQRPSTSPVPPSLPQCPLASPVPPSLVQSLPVCSIAPGAGAVGQARGSGGCHGVRRHGLPCVESRPAVGTRGARGSVGVSQVLYVSHMCCVFTHMISVLCHTRALSHVCAPCMSHMCRVSHVLCVSHTWFPCHMCSLMPVCPACATCMFPACATRVPAMHRCVQGPSRVHERVCAQGAHVRLTCVCATCARVRALCPRAAAAGAGARAGDRKSVV